MNRQVLHYAAEGRRCAFIPILGVFVRTELHAMNNFRIARMTKSVETR